MSALISSTSTSLTFSANAASAASALSVSILIFPCKFVTSIFLSVVSTLMLVCKLVSAASALSVSSTANFLASAIAGLISFSIPPLIVLKPSATFWLIAFIEVTKLSLTVLISSLLCLIQIEK